MAFVPHGVRSGYLLNDTPKRIMEAWRARAREHDTSLANVLGAALAERYLIEFEPSDRPLKSDAIGSDSYFVRLPPAVLDEVRYEAKEAGVSMRSILLDALADSMGLALPTPGELNPPRRPARPCAKHGRPRGRKKGTPA